MHEAADSVKTFVVEITETLQLSAKCAASSPQEAEDIIRAKYKTGDYILGAEQFVGVKFATTEKQEGVEASGL